MPPRTRRAYAVLLGAVAGLEEELASGVSLLHAIGAVDEIHVWASGHDAEAIHSLVSIKSWEKVAAVNSARPTRDATIFDALTVISRTAGDEDLVLIADAEQRSLTELTASSCLSLAAEQGAAMLASRVIGDVVHVDGSGKITWLPPTDSTLVAAGLLVAEFNRLFDLYDWASTVAAGAIQAPYRWSLARLGAFVVVL